MDKKDLQELLAKVAERRVPPGTVFEREVDFGEGVGKVPLKFRRLSYLETQEIRDRANIDDPNDPKQVAEAARIRKRGPIIQIAAMLCDDNGALITTEAEVEKWEPVIIDRTFIQCMNVNAATAEAREEVAKKSETTPDVASSSN